jgi:deoxyhypusine synthase
VLLFEAGRIIAIDATCGPRLEPDRHVAFFIDTLSSKLTDSTRRTLRIMAEQPKASEFLKQISPRRIAPPAIDNKIGVADMIDQAFSSYNAGRLREVCQVFTRKMLTDDCTVGLTLSGALTPAGLGVSCLIPLIRAGFIDWMVSTGANLYHDTHYALDLPLHQSRPDVNDFVLRENSIIRIYDIVFDYQTLLDTDKFYRELISSEAFARTMSTAEFHYEVGRYLHARDQELGRGSSSILAAAYEAGMPIYTSSPGDSSIGMNLAALELAGGKLRIDPLLDVNETAAIVYEAKKNDGTSGVLILGGGSPKNFILQTEPQIQEVLGLEESGHDYFLQITDARPDTGGLSGATASEAMTWGKVVPEQLPDSVTCYTDSTIALPLLTSYAFSRVEPRKLKRLFDKREAMYEALRSAYENHLKSGDETGTASRTPSKSAKHPHK